MATGVSHVEAALGTVPFTTEQGIPQSIFLKDLAMFLTNTQPTLLRPEQQRALIPIAADISVQSTEMAIAQQFNIPKGNAEITYKQHLEQGLLAQRDILITEQQLSEAIARVQQLDPKRDRKELERLAALTARYTTRMRNKERYAPFLPKK